MAESENIITVTDANVGEVIASGLTMIDFWAAWCAPCRLIAPAVEALADEYAGSVKVGKLDVDDNQRTAVQFAVQSIPTILFFRDGQLVDRIVGAVPRQKLEAKIQELVGAAAN